MEIFIRVTRLSLGILYIVVKAEYQVINQGPKKIELWNGCPNSRKLSVLCIKEPDVLDLSYLSKKGCLRVVT